MLYMVYIDARPIDNWCFFMFHRQIMSLSWNILEASRKSMILRGDCTCFYCWLFPRLKSRGSIETVNNDEVKKELPEYNSKNSVYLHDRSLNISFCALRFTQRL